eukprot:692897-Pelagomonas_calceolata.AAC.3
MGTFTSSSPPTLPLLLLMQIDASRESESADEHNHVAHNMSAHVGVLTVHSKLANALTVHNTLVSALTVHSARVGPQTFSLPCERLHAKQGRGAWKVWQTRRDRTDAHERQCWSRQPQALPSMPAHSKLIHGKQWDGPAVLVVFFYVAQQGGALVSRLQQAAP